MKSDTHFVIGKSHLLCEDYAISGEINSLHYLVGSDGCSASRGVDFGSRILCHAARVALEYLLSIKKFNSLSPDDFEKSCRMLIVNRCIDIMKNLNLPPETLDATLSLAVTDGQRVIAVLWGDGSLVLNYEKYINIQTVEFSSGAPFYLSYFMDTQRRAAYMNKFGEAPRFMYRYNSRDRENVRFFLPGYSCKQEFLVRGNNPLVSLALFSDGLNTFYDSNGDSQPLTSTARDLTGFKNIHGEFVKRRMQKVMRNNKNAGIAHQDDLFCAAIVF